jgi:hypothetical protein
MQTDQIGKLPLCVGLRRGHPVGALAASCGGGGCAADLTAARRVRLSVRPVRFWRKVIPLRLLGWLARPTDPCTDRVGHVTRVLVASHG